MKAAGTSESSVNFNQATRHNNLEGSHHQTHHRENHINSIIDGNVHYLLVPINLLRIPFIFFYRRINFQNFWNLSRFVVVSKVKINTKFYTPSLETHSHSDSYKIISRLITVLTRSRYWTLSRASWIQTTPSKYVFLMFKLILFFHLRLDHWNSFFPSGFPTKILCEFASSPPPR